MKERPILFSGSMVRAILEGRKTQTRRVLKHPVLSKPPYFFTGELVQDLGYPKSRANVWAGFNNGSEETKYHRSTAFLRCPYGKPGDRLWVRETFCHKFDDNEMPVYNAEGNLDASCCYYRADSNDVFFPEGGGWTPSIHMPRWASRLALEITDIRVERVQAISHEDAMAEGCGGQGWKVSDDRRPILYPCHQFKELWDSINAARGYSFESNPWVWVVEFRRYV